MAKHHTTYLATVASLAVSIFVNNVHACYDIIRYPNFFSLQFILHAFLEVIPVSLGLVKEKPFLRLLPTHGLSGRDGQSAVRLVERGDRVECVAASLRVRVYLTVLDAELISDPAMSTTVLVRMALYICLYE